MQADTLRARNLGFFNLEAAQRGPETVALIDLCAGVRRDISHGALDRRMDQVAAALLAAGVAAGDGVLLAVGNRAEFIEAFFGAMRAGLVPLPLNIKQARDIIEHIVADAGCVAAIVEPACNPHLVGVVEGLGLAPRFAIGEAPAGWRSYEAALADANPSGYEPPPIAPGQIAFTPYTSGSTGRPKGVLLSHEGMIWGIRHAQRHYPSAPDDRALVAGPLYHKNAMRVSIKPKLYAGGSAVLLPRFEPRSFLTALAEHGCTHAGGVPAMYRMMLQQRDLIDTLRFPALKSLAMGSAVVGRDLIEAVERTFGVGVVEAYGLTEGGGPLGAPADGRPVPRGSCGAAAPEVEVKLVDPDGAESPDAGELWVRSPAVTRGYINQPETTRERIVDGWLRTGDLFRRQDGFFYFQGRVDDRFVCGGENIYPKEVEMLLLRHPDVIDAAVLPVAHPIKGEAPVALVVRRPGAVGDGEALRRFCLDNGPAYAHPRRVFFVDEIPLGATGKIDRGALAARLRALMAEAPLAAADS